MGSLNFKNDKEFIVPHKFYTFLIEALNMSIAENRKHLARLGRKRAQYNMCEGGEVAIGKITTTPKQCNCWMCSNHRKTEGKSIQEIKQEQHYVD